MKFPHLLTSFAVPSTASACARAAPIALALSSALSSAVFAQRVEAPTTQPFGAGALEQVALQRAAARTGRAPSELAIVSSATACFPHTSRRARMFKVSDGEGGAIGVALDDQGVEVDADALAAREERARFQRFGRLTGALFAQRAAARPDERLRVSIWLAGDDDAGLEVPAPEDLAALLPTDSAQEAFSAEIDRVRSEQVRSHTDPVVARLQNAGIEATADEYAPLIHATVTPAQLDLVAAWDEVDRIYEAQSFESAQNCTFTDSDIWPLLYSGMTGGGERIAQVEVGGRVASNPLLFGLTQDTTSVCTSVNGHSTAVAGILIATYYGIGVAMSAQLYATGSCAGWDSELQAASNRAMSWGARAINLSFGVALDTNGVLGAMDRFYDNMVHARRRTIVASAGNRGAGDGDVTSPALGYNVIAVGNYDVGTNCYWFDEAMHPTSSYRDPVSLHNDRQKPDVAAPGTAMLSATTATPWIGDHFADGIEITGTSFSAPVVTGISAILMQRNNALRFWPEAVRAILMASATHNIEGSARSSDKDGAGGVEATWADYVAQRSVYGDWNGMAYNCSYPQNYTVKSVFLSQGDRLRAVIAWDNPTAYANYANQPSADLDLYLDNASGTPVSSSASYDGTSEIVDFSAPANGWYSIRVHKFRCDLSPNYLGWACEIIPYIG